MDFLAVSKRERKLVTHSVTDTKRNQRRKRSYIPRRTRKFQLRITHAEDMHVAEILDYARSERREVTMIRAAIQLQHSLEQGDPSILFERFPWVIEAVKAMIGGGGGGLSEIKSMLEMVMAQQKANGGYTMQPASEPPPAPKQLAGFKPLTAPVFEDDELPAIVTRKDTSTDCNANFMNGLRQLH